ncbi:unnamed protein product [Callosobruchus maculatus]|uniref:CLIP1 zinc knuckle domain-containing protein n=1 Tax=Callosobruchus maculatus TaxID=64391 RepID=A0A653D762_CALMS|nr:unnamed protein product [Callosobruchus maculatus]
MEDLQRKISNLIAELESKSIKISDIEKEKEELRSSLNSENVEFEKSSNDLQQKLKEAEKVILEKTMEVTDRNKKLEDLEKKLSEIEEQTEKRLNEVNEKYQKDIEDSQTKVSNLLAELENKNVKITDIESRVEKARSKAKEKIEEFEMLKTKWENEIQQSETDTENNSKLNEKLALFKCLNEDVKKQIEETLIHYVGLDLEKGDLAEDLKLKIEGLLTATKKIEFLCGEVDNVAKIKEELESTKQKLVTAENEFKLYKSSLNDVEKVNKEKEVIIANLERQNSELQSVNKEILSNKQTQSGYEQRLQTLEKTIQDLSQVNKELEKQRADIEMKLKSSMESESQLKQIIASSTADRTIEKLRQELKDANQKLAENGKQMKEEIDFMKLEVQKNQEQCLNGTSQGDINGEPNAQGQIEDMKPYNQLFEEKIFAESQVKFLNSIIVDMQEKNEKQKARIEILEKGYSSSAADELVALGFKTDFKKPAPRMYCDICEEFDLHETEDCPTQTDWVMIRNSDKPKEIPAPRPYCDNCEVFGHCTEECNEEPQEF